MTDVLYLCHGRLEFTKATLPTLLENTDWERVGTLAVYNDSAPDEFATSAYLEETLADIPFATFRQTNLRSPVSVMMHFLHRTQAERFAKIDNDIVVPPGWLEVLEKVMDDHDLDLLGMQPGMARRLSDEAQERTALPAPHIGGVGLIRTSVFERYPPPPVADGRFGFTEWQHQRRPRCAWVSPDLACFELDRLPVEPWYSLAKEYQAAGLNRKWKPYPPETSHYWEWWTDAPTLRRVKPDPDALVP